MWGTPNKEQASYAVRRFIPTHVGNSVHGISVAGSSSVHPHACGELMKNFSSMHLFCGSSPRMWGTLIIVILEILPCRFIPTHVGNSSLPSYPDSHGPVHPHACGELSHAGEPGRVHGGSSPRMWGTLPQLVIDPIVLRFIPTHVGNSSIILAPIT